MNKVLALLLLLPSIAFCGDLRADQLSVLTQVQTKLSVIKDLRASQVITGDNQEKADAIVASYYDQANKAVGHPVTSSEIDSLIANAPATVTAEAAKASGVSAWVVIMVVLAGFLLTLAVGGLAAWYLWPLFVTFPVEIYELGAYVVTAFTGAAGYLFHPWTFWVVTLEPIWMAVPAALAFAACIYFSYRLHWKSETPSMVSGGPDFFTFPVFLSGICTVVWGGMALFYHSLFPASGVPYFLAFISVMALESFLGFSVITMPGCIAMGWDSDDAVPRSTVASFFIMAAYIVAHLCGSHLAAPVELFRTGCLFIGAFVYYLGLLVMSSKYYSDGSQYAIMQVITCASGLLAFYIGSAAGISQLLGIGGTFFTIYLFEKYVEIPWSGIGWAWAMLGAAVAIYFVVGFATAHPAYFIWTM